MAFDNLPYQPPFQTQEATDYAAEVLALSKRVVESARCVLDIAYGEDYGQKLDIFLPDKSAESWLPVLIFAHGGGWTHGYKEWMGFMAPPITELPAVFVSLSYRLAPAYPYPAALEDCLSALRWIYNHIEDYGGSRNRLFVGGHSAGGHLMALLSLRHEMAEARGIPRDTARACFPVSAPFDVKGHEAFPNEEEAIKASPINYVKGNDTPFFITYGSQDMELVIRTGERMVEALKRELGRVEYHVFEGYDHFKMNLDQGNESNLWVKTVRTWMSSINLKKMILE
jgi:acetyl esterase/lipase